MVGDLNATALINELDVQLNVANELIRQSDPYLKTEQAVSEREAERRAGHFLHAQAVLATAIDAANDTKIAATSLLAAVYAKLLNDDPEKQVTTKKINVEGHPDYIQAREFSEQIERRITYFKTYSKIYENAHIFYRQLAKGEYNG